MPNTVQSKKMTKDIQNTNSSIAAASLIIFVFQVFIFTIFKKLIATLLSLQIIVHLGLCNVKLPGNTTTIISTLKQVTYFKLFGKLAELNKEVFPFDYQE